MRRWIIAAFVAVTLGGAAEAKDMKSCAADYKTAKAGAALGGQSYMKFMSACMKGGLSVGQTVTTKPANGPKIVETTAAPSTKVADAPMNATAKCKDGSFSMAAHHSGSCSHHGGVAQFLK